MSTSKLAQLYHLRYFFFITLSGVGILLLSILVFIASEEEQVFLTPPIVLLSIFFSFSFCISVARLKPSGQIDWFHPSILYLLVYLVYFIFPGILLWLLNDYQPIWIGSVTQPRYLVNTAFILGSISIAFFNLGASIKFRSNSKSSHDVICKKNVIRFKEARYIVLLFLFIGIALKLFHLSLIGPLNLELMNYLSPAARREFDLHISNFIVMSESTLNWAVLIALFYYLLRYIKVGRHRLGYLFVLIALLTIVLILVYIVSAKRSEVIPLIFLPIIWYCYLIKRITLKKALVLGSFVGFLLSSLLIARIVLPLISKGLSPSDYVGSNYLEVIRFYFNTMEWSTFEMFLASIVERDEILLNIGGPIKGFFYYNLNTLHIFIPRAIWSSKPEYHDLSYIYYHIIWGGDAVVGAAPTIWGASYLFFNVAGLSIGMLFLGWIFKIIYVTFKPYTGSIRGVFFYSIFLWMAFQFLRFGTLGFTVIYFVQAMIVGVIAGLFLFRRYTLNKE